MPGRSWIEIKVTAMIEIGQGIEIGPGVEIGTVSVFAAFFVTEILEENLITETGDRFTEE